MSVTNSATWAAPSPTTEVVTGGFWYDWVKPTAHLDDWGEFGRPRRCKRRCYLCKSLAVQLTSTGSVTLWSRDLANDKINDQEVGSSTSQVAQEDLTHFVER